MLFEFGLDDLTVAGLDLVEVSLGLLQLGFAVEQQSFGAFDLPPDLRHHFRDDADVLGRHLVVVDALGAEQTVAVH